MVGSWWSLSRSLSLALYSSLTLFFAFVGGWLLDLGDRCWTVVVDGSLLVLGDSSLSLLLAFYPHLALSLSWSLKRSLLLVVGCCLLVIVVGWLLLMVQCGWLLVLGDPSLALSRLLSIPLLLSLSISRSCWWLVVGSWWSLLICCCRWVVGLSLSWRLLVVQTYKVYYVSWTLCLLPKTLKQILSVTLQSATLQQHIDNFDLLWDNFRTYTSTYWTISPE